MNSENRFAIVITHEGVRNNLLTQSGSCCGAAIRVACPAAETIDPYGNIHVQCNAKGRDSCSGARRRLPRRTGTAS
jgi:hypothetical protein